jgi:PAS domain S-box-containing protein
VAVRVAVGLVGLIAVLYLAAMRATAASAFGLLAMALWLTRTADQRSRNAGFVWILAGVVIVLAAITLRLSPGTAGCFLALAIAFLGIDRWQAMSHGLTLAAMLTALIALTGYLDGISPIYASTSFTFLAIPAATGILALCAGLLAARPQVGLARLMTESGRPGPPVQTIILGILTLPIVLGATVLSGHRAGWYGAQFAIALHTVLLVVAAVSIVWVTGAHRRRVETRRSETENALRESEERFRTMADNILNLAWMAHPDGNVFWFNQRWYEYTGTSWEQMQERGWHVVQDPQFAWTVREQWKLCIAGGKPFEAVYPLRGADGVFRPFLTRVQPVFGPDGKIDRWFGTNTDISAERKTQEELQKANRMLEEYAFASAHDLQEPLRMVNINIDLLMQELHGRLTGDALEYAELAKAAVKQMDRLIRDLLQFSRATNYSARDESSVSTVDLNKSLQRALTAVSARITETRANITAAELPVVNGDETQMAQVLQNLLANSLKYKKAQEAPRINISASKVEREWVICVQDNGIGFEPQYAQRIFGLFKRLHREEYEGTGLGLAICQRIVERFGGRVWAESQLGMGSRFYFALHAAEETAGKPGAAMGASAGG